MSTPSNDRSPSPVCLANATETDYPRQSCVHELLEVQVQHRPVATAAEFEGQCLTYTELHARANQLARLLRQRGVHREVLVGVCVGRSLEMVVALLGILKAGGACVPLDPSYGRGRIQYVLDEAKVRALITQESLRNSLPVTTQM